ncbi:IS3 family transposase [Sebaldella termitidis]|uniref:IS3 family transposase n=1 Tax=Sebaldella termitidis TaxID=826 RepID=UPI00351A1ADD
MKKELIYALGEKSFIELKQYLFVYIEGFCNTRRIQKKSSYLSSREYLKKNLNRQEKCVQVIDISSISRFKWSRDINFY